MKAVRLAFVLLAIGTAPLALGQADPAKLFCASPTDLCIKKDDMIRNPTTGVMEKVVSLVFNPYGSVLTDVGHYIWAGPLTTGYTFTIPAVPAVPHLDAIPADNTVTPPRPARPEQLAVDAIPARTMVIMGIVRAPDTDPSDDDDDPPPPPQPPVQVKLQEVGKPETLADVDLEVTPPGDAFPPGFAGSSGKDPESLPLPTPVAGEQHQYKDERIGRWGDNGRDGWGIEICFFGCWTIGESAQNGQGGGNGETFTDVVDSTTWFPVIRTKQAGASGVAVSSQGGNGGSGGDAWGALPAADGGGAGTGGNVAAISSVDIQTEGAEAHGIYVQSRAGFGGDGGNGYIFAGAGRGGPAALAGNAEATNTVTGRVVTTGDSAIGVFAQSIGGGGGNGGDSYGIVGDAGSASFGGNGGNATATNNGYVSTGTSVNGVSTGGKAAHGVMAQSVGGTGGSGGNASGLTALGGGASGGGDGGTATANNGATGVIITQGSSAIGLYAQSVGGGGGDGGSASGISAVGGSGGAGGDGRIATANNLAGGTILTIGDASYGILAQSIGGGGGNGGDSGGVVAIGGAGNSGGNGGHATANNRGQVDTFGTLAYGVLVQSIGGGGGSGGAATGLVAIGGSSTASTDPNQPLFINKGGEVDVLNDTDGLIRTRGQGANGVLAQSIGGGGGAGGSATGGVSLGGSGGIGGSGDAVDVINKGTIETLGVDAKGIVAQSIGGGGGSAAYSAGAVALGGSGATGGSGGAVHVDNQAGGEILTHARGADGIVAQSIGGGGGNGASTAGIGALGGTGAGGGNGFTVDVTNNGTIRTGLDVQIPGGNLPTGAFARGILAQSIGGGGGNGGDGGGLIAIGGNATGSSLASQVTVTNNGIISTRGNMSSAIEAQSIGGGGGNGGSSGGAFLTVGGSGSGGGDGGKVVINNNRDLTTLGNDSHGIFAQSIGGGGGNGGSSTALGIFTGTAIGGAGAAGGKADTVTINANPTAGVTPTIHTLGDRAKGILAQSVGGGGGNGGFAATASIGYTAASSLSVGGKGGAGGNASTVTLNGNTSIVTEGTDADGVVAQSVGGSGGNGGFAISFAGAGGDAAGVALAAGIGGRGGDGGEGGNVTLRSGGSILTTGGQSDGIVAQSVGGGGGTGGFAITLTAAGAGGTAGAASVSIGGDGGKGGKAGIVDAQYTGDIRTEGDDSFGAVLQGIGGGGGTGGFTVAGAVTGAGGASAAASVGVGGAGGDGGVGGKVIAHLTGDLTTLGDRSTGLVAQSVGGRGGNGGFNISGSINGAGGGSGAAAIGVGGAGGKGGHAETVNVTVDGDALTQGMDADAIVVQSIGGGGGNGGMNVSGTVTGSGGGSGGVSVGVGGDAGTASNGNLATAVVNGNIDTTGQGSNAFIVQSIGGAGGNGGMNVTGTLTGAGGGAAGVSVGIGGGGGMGGNGSIVNATLNGSAVTRGTNATAIIAQSLGGSGGNGGMNVTGTVTASGNGAGSIALGVGGSGAGAGNAALTTLHVTGNVDTVGTNSGGILAQALGGGGGNGGMNISGAVSASGGTAGSVAIGVGGAAGGGGNGGAVDATVTGLVHTRGDNSAGITAQSLGGGGGNGGMNVTGTLSGSGSTAGAVSVGVGGSGGGAGNGLGVIAHVTGGVVTEGDNSHGFFAQSLGGGGGNGGMNVVGAVSGSGGSGGAVAVGVGGSGGGGGNASTVVATLTGNATTTGNNSIGVVAQSLGGGGGNGALNVTGAVAAGGDQTGAVAVGVGAAGGGAGTADLATLILDGDVSTAGENSGGVLVQSVGGGGGNGGLNATEGLSASGSTGGAVSVGVGGAGGGGGNGGGANATIDSNVHTRGAQSTGVTVQSLGGGGGNSSINVTGAVALSGSSGGAVAIGVGAAGGGAGDGGTIGASITSGTIVTEGDQSHGVLYQSVGGGGGNGSINVVGTLAGAASNAGSLSVGIGGKGGAGGNGGQVTGGISADVATLGDDSFGVLMQSVGGGGGNGAMNVSGAVSLGKNGAGALSVGLGGSGGTPGNGFKVAGDVTGAVQTLGARSTGVLAQSVGGGGGNGGMNFSESVALTKEAGGAVSVGVGGFGGGGGSAETVALTRTGLTTTSGAGSDGVVAQSIGGGGGNGGMNVSGALSASSSGNAIAATLGIGGFGGGGGAANTVTANVTGDVLATGFGALNYALVEDTLQRTISDGSNGVLAQSIGGAGGNGGINISAGIAFDNSNNGQSHTLNLGLGGFGGSGGDAGAVNLTVNAARVQSVGDHRFGVGAQSVGGGGGNGGMNVSGGIAMDGVITAGVGGFGGDGGVARAVTATANTDISAVGAGAIGFFAQSIGGGGGNGGINISGGIQGGSQTSTPSLVLGLGGFGGAGNVSDIVVATQRGNVTVQGNDSIGVLAQSVAGGGGTGGMNVSGNIARGTGYAGSIGVGGSGGTGANAQRVTLVSDGHVSVDGRDANAAFDLNDAQFEATANRERASGVLVQSIGGGGGNGGMNITGVIAPMGSTLLAGVGGSGSGGGDGGEVFVRRGQLAESLIDTYGNNASGLTAQSIGGGGGNAGMNFMLSASGQNNRAVNIGVGGSGASPGDGKQVDVINVGDIVTRGDHSTGMLAQSVGGGGGSATYNIGYGRNPDATAVNIAIGGEAGPGGDGGLVHVDHTGDITTLGTKSIALFAQSVGGGGGDTGMDLVTSPDANKGLDIALGRKGGTGGTGGDVWVSSDGRLATAGEGSTGLLAQSVGKGGGESSSSSIELASDGGGGKGQDRAVSLEVGIEGGSGGVAGDVEVHAAGSIVTQGTNAEAIRAQSVGGGGGNGGAIERQPAVAASNQIQIGVGGSGGLGGTAGAVLVDNAATLETSGDQAHGIFAQSIGGGGGMGGYAASVDLESGGGTGGNSFSLTMGGDGGEGSTASTVDVLNTGNILTTGRHAFGIYAQSTGGGGGVGGAIMKFGQSSGETTRALSLNVGGTGGIGGTSDAVTVTNEGVIETHGEESDGIRATSIGGKGGDAGLILDLGVQDIGSNQSSTRLNMTLGGDGGEGGTGGDVTVTNRAQAGVENSGVIVTQGRAARGIFAQSVGGGGGNGSSILNANAGASNRGNVTLVDLLVGGDGGVGAAAGNVHVTNDSVIDTSGDDAHGIFAQSIGGGGGNGGLVLAANAVLAAGDVANEALLVLGGAGGDGDDAGDVTVDNTGRIVTRGAHAHGIFAQSIGGGGGNAGIGFGASTNPATSVIAGTMSALFGGRGGVGGLGGHVTVNHSGDITVLGANSQAVVAESINGGGGHLALDFNGVTSLPGVPDEIYEGIPLPSGTTTDTVLVFGGGGDHQQNSDAGRVTLNYTGTFGVAGNNGAANAVQAIGGGGGTFDLTLALNDTAGSADDVAIRGRLGGVSGTNNRGGDIESSHDGNLITEGDNTPGALVQSIGGGGGRANLDLSSEHGSIGATQLTLGGQDGDNEEGGDIEHTQNGSVATQGNAAHGGLFQSIGGGGGSLSLMESGGTAEAGKQRTRGDKLRFADGGSAQPQAQAVAANVPQLSFGSSGGSLLKGGNVGLDLAGNIGTTGDNALGMIFQSVGAGGGVASVLGVDGLAVTLGGSHGASGDGGNLAVINTGDVTTAGTRSHGVFLQSIGGGGSAVFTDADAPGVTLSSDNIGNGGNISFEQNGTIATLGDCTYSLFAQSVGGGGGYVDGAFAASAGGAGTAGAIDLELNGDIAALGDSSTALFAQSAGADGLGGNITAALAAGKQVVGGEDGVAVHFDGGAVNRFTNRGLVRTLSGPQGFAFRGGAGGDFIDNFGAVMGNIDLGGGANGFANNAGAFLYSGDTINLGAPANYLVNNGTIAPGAEQLAVRTYLNGSYRQTSGALADFEMDFTSGIHDAVFASGMADVAGGLRISLLNVHNIRPGLTEMPVFVTAGGVIDRGVILDAQPSIVIKYGLRPLENRILAVTYDVDFNADGLTGNRREVGEYLNRVQGRVERLGPDEGLGQTITAAVLTTDLGVYADMLTQLGTEFYAEQQALGLKGVQRFSRNLQNCGTLSIGETAGDETGCVWARYDDNPSTRDTRAGFPAAKDSGSSISTGVQRPLDGGWTIGVGVDFEDHRGSGYDGLWTAEGNFTQLGGSARRAFGASSVGATLSLGSQTESVSRWLGVTGLREARGERDVYFLSNVLDYTYNIAANGFTLQPSLSIGTSMLRHGSMTERGADVQNAVIDSGSETHLWAEPAIAGRYSATFGSGASLRTFLRVGLMQYLSGTSTKVRASLAGDQGAASPMRIGSDLDRSHFVGEVGLQYETAAGFTMGLSYAREESQIREGDAGSFRFVLPLQ
ncbi:MAG: autotransporter outer membrane beta-barrel domain-containing protein [Pseudomonadota bacterium]